MSGVWNRTLVYLGLREEPDEAYDGSPERFVPEDDPHAEHAPPRRTAEPAAASAAAEPARRVEPSPSRAGRNGAGEATPAADHDNVLSLRAGDVHVRTAPAAPLSRATIVRVAQFDDVEAVGARYRTGQPVVFDVSVADATTARRVVDFVAGLTYALRGELTKVGSRAFLVVPSGVTLPADERRRLGELGYRLPTGSDA